MHIKKHIFILSHLLNRKSILQYIIDYIKIYTAVQLVSEILT